MKIACIGECMIELKQTTDQQLAQGYGGDTLNTAIYLARLGMKVDYITALGDDPWSDEMIAIWQTEGIGTGRVCRIAGKLPGLYSIKNNPAGERDFYYWRDNSAARYLLDLPEAGAILNALAEYDLIYLSGITLSLYDRVGRARLVAALDRARRRSTKVAFDTNFRPRGWPDPEIAKRAYQDVFSIADIVLASIEDLDLLFGRGAGADSVDQLTVKETVLKFSEPACRVRAPGIDRIVTAEPVSRVVDTTAAGDSFSSAYLAARLNGVNPVEAARAGHRLAATVVRYPGAIIPLVAMPDRIMSRSTPISEMPA